MKKKKIGLIVCCVLLIYFIGGIIYNFAGINKINNKKNVDNSIQIKGYEYLCQNDKTELYKSEFKILKDNLENDDIDYKEYAFSLSKLFIIELYTLNNKKNMYDVGGVDFVYPEGRENYKLNVENTLYKYMEDINDGKRKQELPEVSSVEIISNEDIEYSVGDTMFSGYKINLDIGYVKDLGYDNKAEVILIKRDKYIYVVEKN